MAKMLGNDASIFLDAFDLSLGGREAVISARADVLEATDLSDTEVANELGIQSVEFTYSGLWDTVSAGNEEAIRTLHGSTSAKFGSVHFGSTEGASAIGFQVFTADYTTQPRLKELVPLSGGWAANGGADFGQILAPKTTASADSTFASIDGLDRGASSGSADGGVWGYHVMAISGTWDLDFEHSSSDGAYAGYDSVTGVSGTGGARRSSTSTLKRFTRLVADMTSTGGSITIAAFQRRL